jgi:hypothetical protein
VGGVSGPEHNFHWVLCAKNKFRSFPCFLGPKQVSLVPRFFFGPQENVVVLVVLVGIVLVLVVVVVVVVLLFSIRQKYYSRSIQNNATNGPKIRSS